jgi:hypothetical protein
VTVYVDDAAIRATVADGKREYKAQWYHLTADTKDELHGFAKRLGLQRRWFQDKPHGLWHYDVTKSKRELAVRMGATEIAARDISVYQKPGREGREGHGDEPPVQ